MFDQLIVNKVNKLMNIFGFYYSFFIKFIYGAKNFIQLCPLLPPIF